MEVQAKTFGPKRNNIFEFKFPFHAKKLQVTGNNKIDNPFCEVVCSKIISLIKSCRKDYVRNLFLECLKILKIKGRGFLQLYRLSLLKDTFSTARNILVLLLFSFDFMLQYFNIMRM